jgi:hypothetical protein
MPRTNPPYAIWSIWLYLPLMQKVLSIGLCVFGVYSLYSAAVTVLNLRSLASVPHKKGDPSIRRTFAMLRSRCNKLQQYIGAAFYLFGLVLFLGLQRAYFTIELSNTPVGSLILENFVVCFAFAANVFLILLVLHFVQWFASGLVGAFALRLDAIE